jgi:acetoin utilization protein AcuB
MKHNPQVIAFMTPFPHTVDIDAPLEDAHKLMREHRFRHLPVTANGKIVGVLTDRDISLILGPDFDSPDERELKVRNAHIEEACIVPASTPVAKVARLMADNRNGSAIVTKHDKLVGIFTVTDACRALAEVLHDHEDQEPDIVA